MKKMGGMHKGKNTMHEALEGIAEAMAKLELEKVKGYKKKKKDDDEDDDEEGLIKVLEATKES